MIPLKNQAIQNALLGNWEKAIEINKQIIKENSEDKEAMNRLAHALTVTGKIDEAKKIYQKVLKLDSLNVIAERNIKLLASTSTKDQENKKCQTVIEGLENMFLEETGKTKMVELVNIAESKTISSLRVGESLTLHVKRLKIHVLNSDKQYLGVIPDDLGKRLIKLLDGGNTYKVFTKSINNHSVSVFVREDKRATKFKNMPSFLSASKTKNTLTGVKEAEDEEEAAEEE